MTVLMKSTHQHIFLICIEKVHCSGDASFLLYPIDDLRLYLSVQWCSFSVYALYISPPISSKCRPWSLWMVLIAYYHYFRFRSTKLIILLYCFTLRLSSDLILFMILYEPIVDKEKGKDLSTFNQLKLNINRSVINYLL